MARHGDIESPFIFMEFRIMVPTAKRIMNYPVFVLLTEIHSVLHVRKWLFTKFNEIFAQSRSFAKKQSDYISG